MKIELMQCDMCKQEFLYDEGEVLSLELHINPGTCGHEYARIDLCHACYEPFARTMRDLFLLANDKRE